MHDPSFSALCTGIIELITQKQASHLVERDSNSCLMVMDYCSSLDQHYTNIHTYTYKHIIYIYIYIYIVTVKKKDLSPCVL